MKHILTLVCLTIGIGATAQEFGQRKGFRGIVTKADKSIELNEVEVNSSLAKTTYAAATRQITVLTAKQIQELPVNIDIVYWQLLNLLCRVYRDLTGCSGIGGLR